MQRCHVGARGPQEKIDELTVEHLKADDVRIAVSDCEDNIKPVRAGDTTNSLLNPQVMAQMKMLANLTDMEAAMRGGGRGGAFGGFGGSRFGL